MALDPEEFRKRRLQRAQDRAKQQALRKRMLVKFAIAVAAVVLSILVIFAIESSVNKKKAADKAKKVEKTGKTTTIHLAAAGDLNVSSALVDADGSGLDYEAMFMDVAHLLADADVTVLNYEGVLYGAPYGESKSAPQSLMQALSRAGVDFVQLANSYSIYRGVSGLATTIDNVRSAGMEPLGVYKDEKDFEKSGGFTLCEVRGVKIAFVAFTKGMDGTALPRGSESCVNLLYTDYSTTYQKVNTEGITRVLKAVEKEEPDLTVALLHWGSKKADNVSASQREIRNLLQDNGVDAIIGTHPNFVQEMDLDEEDNTFVAYSLGQFVSEDQKAGTEYSVILDLEITKNNETGETRITGFTYTPVFTVAEEGKPLKVVRIAQTMAAYEAGYIEKVSEETYTAMQYALERVDARVKGQS